jgi:hypothetical protein
MRLLLLLSASLLELVCVRQYTSAPNSQGDVCSRQPSLLINGIPNRIAMSSSCLFHNDIIIPFLVFLIQLSQMTSCTSTSSTIISSSTRTFFLHPMHCVCNIERFFESGYTGRTSFETTRATNGL